MADLATGDVTVSVEKSRRGGPGQRANTVKITFGDGAKTYPSGGVPLPAKESFGLTYALEDLIIIDPDDSNGLAYKYDHSNQKLRMYELDMSATGDSPMVEMDSGSDAPAAQELYAITVGF